ncbi:MAG TPA: alpha/beta hydrolase [Alphaproteobacteria bacterium]|jgi:pimeloyl-ACP methyl ester carboxylesterase|nr:alpha/beta hydrolase [Alphaproteobacteria bacterium]
MDLKVDGKRVFAATGGRAFDAAAPAIVFIHGAGFDHTAWQLQARYFAHHGRSVLAIDLPGHGRSEGPALASIAAAADWVGHLLDAAGTKSAALVGHSMGALIALAAAARLPERVRALALLGVAAKMPVHPDLLGAAERNEPRAGELIVDWGFGPAAHLGGHRAPGLWMMGGGLRTIERSAPGVLATDLAACNAYDGAEADAARVRCPTLFVLGAADKMTPLKGGLALAAKIAGARVARIECGHMMMVERPDATLDALREAL